MPSDHNPDTKALGVSLLLRTQLPSLLAACPFQLSSVLEGINHEKYLDFPSASVMSVARKRCARGRMLDGCNPAAEQAFCWPRKTASQLHNVALGHFFPIYLMTEKSFLPKSRTALPEDSSSAAREGRSGRRVPHWAVRLLSVRNATRGRRDTGSRLFENFFLQLQQ